MTCTKTGAHIYLVSYREFVYGDAFELEPFYGPEKEVAKLIRELSYNGHLEQIKDFAYFHLIARSREPINELREVHYVVHDWDNWFNKGTLSSHFERLNTSFLMTNNFTRETISLERLAELYP
jgi:hypothetical protein